MERNTSLILRHFAMINIAQACTRLHYTGTLKHAANEAEIRRLFRGRMVEKLEAKFRHSTNFLQTFVHCDATILTVPKHLCQGEFSLSA